MFARLAIPLAVGVSSTATLEAVTTKKPKRVSKPFSFVQYAKTAVLAYCTKTTNRRAVITPA